MRESPVESTAPPTGVTQGRPAFLGKRHLVSSSHYLASQTGLRMFERGSNAIDAGVAAGIALNVLDRHLTDFGGVAPTMIFRPGMAEPETIDGLGQLPASPDLAAYRARHGACGPWSQGPLVPMTLDLLEGYDIASLGPGSTAFLHRYAEAFKLAAADREGFFGDPDQGSRRCLQPRLTCGVWAADHGTARPSIASTGTNRR